MLHEKQQIVIFFFSQNSMHLFAVLLLLATTCTAQELQPAAVAQLAGFQGMEKRQFVSSSSSFYPSSSSLFFSSSFFPSSSSVPGGRTTTCQSVQPGPSLCARACGPGYVQCSAETCYNPGEGQSCCSNGGTSSNVAAHRP